MRNELVMEGELDWSRNYDDVQLYIDKEDVWDKVGELLDDFGDEKYHPHVRLVLSLGANDA